MTEEASSTNLPTVIHGGCHCGNMAFRLTWPDAGPIPARRCGCSFCTMRGGVWTSHPGAELFLSIQDRSQVSPYEFGTRTAEFHVCRTCGVVPIVTSTVNGRVYAVVNVNTFRDFDQSRLDVSPSDFDGEDTGSRLERRARNWIGSVCYDENSSVEKD